MKETPTTNNKSQSALVSNNQTTVHVRHDTPGDAEQDRLKKESREVRALCTHTSTNTHLRMERNQGINEPKVKSPLTSDT